MKTIKVLLAILITSAMFSFCSAGEKVPQRVKDAFAKKFPTAKSVKWDKESANEWEAEFKINKMEYSANFSEDGTWKETEHEVSMKEVPQNVQDALKTAYAGYNIKESEISETSGGTTYEFEIKKDGETMEVAIDSGGNVAKKEMKEDNEGSENDDND